MVGDLAERQVSERVGSQHDEVTDAFGAQTHVDEAPERVAARVGVDRLPVTLRTGPGRALGADTQSDAEVRGDLACRRLGSERKYVKRIDARDAGKAGRQFAR